MGSQSFPIALEYLNMILSQKPIFVSILNTSKFFKHIDMQWQGWKAVAEDVNVRPHINLKVSGVAL